MSPTSGISLKNLRCGAEGLSGAFEEFCCQILRRAPEAPCNGLYRRIRGAGGDGGVEAYWESCDGRIWGLQAKYFSDLKSSNKSQMKASFQSALSNYPTLSQYTFCLPITLTGTKGGKAGTKIKGQHKILSNWFDEWRAAAAELGRNVTIDVWDESELVGRLISADVNGGIRRFWFDKTVLSVEWFQHHLSDAKAQAGKRYTPELSIETALNKALEAFGRSRAWVSEIEDIGATFLDKVDWWRRVATGRSEAAFEELSTNLAEESRNVLEQAEKIAHSLDAVTERPEILQGIEFREAVLHLLNLARSLEPQIKAALEKKHGEHADSAGFRQWSAEYMVSFPMAPLDHLRDLITALNRIERLVTHIESQLPAARAMLVRGPAGIGKTHGILDAAFERLNADQFSLVFFGEDFDGENPWSQIIAKCGLGLSTGRDELLDALDAASEATGLPLVIFVDALNETRPDRRKWQAWLPPMIEQVSRRRSLKLCFSCRDNYLTEVLPEAVDLPAIEHNGFAGREYDAVFQFFQFYGLGPPVGPLLQEEFSNPLFLHLVCAALRDSGRSAIPTGTAGFTSIVDLLLRSKNERVARICDYDPRENRLQQAVRCLAAAMAKSENRQVPIDEAKSAIEALYPSTGHSKSLFSLLEGESLIAVSQGSPESTGNISHYYVRFTFERMGDHFIVDHLLSGLADEISTAFQPGGKMHFIVADQNAIAKHSGLLEAAAVQIPELYKCELTDVVSISNEGDLIGPILSGLQWRNPGSITAKTAYLVRHALNSANTENAIEALLKLSFRPSHLLNISYLEKIFLSLPMLVRDPYWAYQLERSFSGWEKETANGAVFRLIEWALKSNLGGVSVDVALLWTTTLAWFCASPDRRIRDRSTKGMVRLLREKPEIICPLISKFANAEDEYIAERVLVAAYGALLLQPDPKHVHEVATEICSQYFGPSGPPLNASLRDHARLIVELAVDLSIAPDDISEAHFRPPYESPWPISLPSEGEVAEFADDKKRFPRMDLVEQAGMATGTDFARYIVHPTVSSAFDIEGAGLDELGLFRWFLWEAVAFGYPGPEDRCAEFDRFLLGKFGGGRGKPGWAERLGKKYYWIFLRRLTGQIADHVPRKNWTGELLPPSSDLQALNLRDTDPSDIRMFAVPPSDISHEWFIANPYRFTGTDESSGDKAWISKDDLPELSSTFTVTDGTDTNWLVLSLSVAWDGKRTDRKVKTYRHVSRSIHALTCSASDFRRLEELLAQQYWKPDFHEIEPHDYRGYLAEYPLRWSYRQRFSSDFSFVRESDGISFEPLALHQLKGGEWGYDYSVDRRVPGLMMPSPCLVDFGCLRWDGLGSWLDMDGRVAFSDPTWWKDIGPALLVRSDFLEKFVFETGRILIIFGYQVKFVVGMGSENLGMKEEHAIFAYQDGQIRMLQREYKRR